MAWSTCQNDNKLYHVITQNYCYWPTETTPNPCLISELDQIFGMLATAMRHVDILSDGADVAQSEAQWYCNVLQ